jgi:hypothetical protein
MISQSKENFPMNSTYKLILAAVCIAAPLFGSSPAEAGGRGHSVRYGRSQGGWAAQGRDDRCSSGSGDYVDRHDDSRRVRRGRSVRVRVEQNNWGGGQTYGQPRPVGNVYGDIYGDEQTVGGKSGGIVEDRQTIGGKSGGFTGGKQVGGNTGSVAGGKQFGGNTGGKSLDVGSDDYGQTGSDNYGQTGDDIYGSEQRDDNSSLAGQNLDNMYGDSDDYGQNANDVYGDSYDYDQNQGDMYGDSYDDEQNTSDDYGDSYDDDQYDDDQYDRYGRYNQDGR